MKSMPIILTVIVVMLLVVADATAIPVELGYQDGTLVKEPTGGDVCPGADLLASDDGTFENGYLWGYVQEPDWSSWAEGYNSQFVCGVRFLLTQTGFYSDETMDVYVWDSNPEGDPAPGPDPGNVICFLPGIDPGPIALWPEISTHDVQVCCQAGGNHFVGFWPNWPGVGTDVWFIAADENGPGNGHPRTKIAPGIGYPTGWQHPDVVPPFGRCEALGIRELSGMGDCTPTANRTATWGRIKAMY